MKNVHGMLADESETTGKKQQVPKFQRHLMI